MNDQTALPICTRRLGFESLEDRRLLSGSSVNVAALQSEWSNFTLADDVNVIEIEASAISLQAINEALESAAGTNCDDLILLHTTTEHSTVAYTKSIDGLTIDFDVAVSGRVTLMADGNVPLTIDAQSLCRVLTVSDTSEVQLANLVITGGKATTDLSGAAALYGLGGGIASAGTLRLDQVQVTQNKADSGLPSDTNIGFNSKGGGIYNTGSLSIFRSDITGNTACSGEPNKKEGAAYGAGGGIFNETNASLDLHDTTIANNDAASGTKIIQGESTSVTVDVTGRGGGIYNTGTVVVSEESVLSTNSAWFGGGLYNSVFCNAELTLSTVVDNEACENGAGIYSDQGSFLKIATSFIQGNKATASGGGIALRGNLSLTGSVVSGNSAGTDGGGIYFYGTYNVTIPDYTIRIVNTTITGNICGVSANGSGGGLYFIGTRLGTTFATLILTNSIIVQNKVTRQTNTADDENIYVSGTCQGYRSLSTFDDWSNSDENYRYDSSVPLFVRDYNFSTKAEGNYQLVWDADSQAIDTGNNALARNAGLVATSKDIAGQPRIQNSTIDLGAYEYQPTAFESAFPLDLSMQQGSFLTLRCEGTDTNGNAYTRYWVDFNGDGEFDISGSELCISWNDLLNRGYDKGYIGLAVENSLGERSDVRQMAIHFIEVMPSVEMNTHSLLDDQILKLALTVSCYGRSIQQWTINWGDGTMPVPYECVSSSISLAHYYGPQTGTRTFSLTLVLVDTNGHGGDVTYLLGSYTIEGSSRAALPVEPLEIAALPNEISSETQKPVALLLPVNESEENGRDTDTETGSNRIGQTSGTESGLVDTPVHSLIQSLVLDDDNTFARNDYDSVLKAHRFKNEQRSNQELESDCSSSFWAAWDEVILDI